MNLDKRGLLIGLWLVITGMMMAIMMIMMMMTEYQKVFVLQVFQALAHRDNDDDDSGDDDDVRDCVTMFAVPDLD